MMWSPFAVRVICPLCGVKILRDKYDSLLNHVKWECPRSEGGQGLD